MSERARWLRGVVIMAIGAAIMLVGAIAKFFPVSDRTVTVILLAGFAVAVGGWVAAEVGAWLVRRKTN